MTATDNPRRFGDLNQLIVKLGDMGETESVSNLESIRAVLESLAALKMSMRQNQDNPLKGKPPLEALDELNGALAGINASIDAIEAEDSRRRTYREASEALFNR